MSLKRRAVQCSGYVPASQYVPVYSRPHRTNNARWHEELCPITPKPSFDDAYDTRIRSIHDAVKQWLESSPSSVIGPVCRSRSPSSGSPPSHPSFLERVVPKSSDSYASPAGRDTLAPPSDTEYNRAEHVGTALSSSIQVHESSDRVRASYDGGNTRDQAITMSKLVNSREEEFLFEGEPSAQVEEENKKSHVGEKAGNKGPIADLNSLDQKHLSSLSEISANDLRKLSKEFDFVLAAAATGRDSANFTESSNARGVEPDALPPEILLRPPRGHDDLAGLSEGDQGSATDESEIVTRGSTSDEFEDLYASAPVFPSRANEEKDVEDSFVTAPVIEDTRFVSGPSSRKIDEFCPTIGPNIRSGAAPVPVRGSFRNSLALTAGNALAKPDDWPTVASNRVASDAGGCDGCSSLPRRRLQPPYNLSGCVGNYVASQGKSEVFNPCATKRSPSTPQHRRNVQKNEKQLSPARDSPEKANTDQLQARAAAWQNAKNVIFLNRYKREESKIHDWEEHKIAKASVALSNLEIEFQMKRAKATEKMDIEVARIHRRAEEKRKNAEAKRAERAARAALQAQFLRVLGKSPVSCFCF